METISDFEAFESVTIAFTLLSARLFKFHVKVFLNPIGLISLYLMGIRS